MIYDLIIIGAGPAGMSAAVYACRKKLSTLILSKDIGGQTAKSWGVENYLGYSLISGGELAVKFKEHLDSFSCAVFKSPVQIIDLKKVKKHFEVKTGDKTIYQGRSVIIASGKEPRELTVPGEKEYRGKGVTYCATCDAPLFTNQLVAVIGDGNSALDAAYQLTKIAKKIYLISPEKKFRSDVDKVLLDKIKQSPKIKVIFRAKVSKIVGNKFVTGLNFLDLVSGKTLEIKVTGIFVEIGSVTSVDFAAKLIKLNEKKEIVVDQVNMTSVPGIFAAGDVTNVVEKQVIIAAGEGAKAAIAVANYLSRLKQ